MHRVHQLGTSGHGCERQAAAERLAGDDQVRLDAVALDRPHRAGTPAAGLNLVVDVEDPVRVAELAQGMDELRRHRDEAAFALYRLEDDARDLARVDILLEEQPEALHGVLGRDAPVRIGRGRAVHAAGERAEALLVDELRSHRHGQVGAAVEGPVEDDDSGPPGCRASDLDCVLDRLGAGVQEQRLRRGFPGPELVELLGDCDVRLVHPDHEALMEVAVDLLVHGTDDGRVAVAEVLAGDAAGEVDVLAAVGVPDPRTPGARDDEIGRRDAARNEPLAALEDVLGGRAFFDPHCPGVSHYSIAR